MAALFCRRELTRHHPLLRTAIHDTPSLLRTRRRLKSSKQPKFGFAFDIDGVLLRSSTPLPNSSNALHFLSRNSIPFILLTNGGGKPESIRAADLSRRLGVEIPERALIQSHTPFRFLVDGTEPSTSSSSSNSPSSTTSLPAGTLSHREVLRDAHVLVIGGHGPSARHAAQSYGFRNVLIPSDVFAHDAGIWPFSAPFSHYHTETCQPKALPLPLATPDTAVSDLRPDTFLQINSILVFNDPRDMGLDIQLVIDLLLSHEGYLGTQRFPVPTPSSDTHASAPRLPTLHFSNPDLFWSAAYKLGNRLGQAGFRHSLEGIWRGICAAEGIDPSDPVCELRHRYRVWGKPSVETYAFAERALYAQLDGGSGRDKGALESVYMVGDNPASDIAGANAYKASGTAGSQWKSVLVRTGVYDGHGRDGGPDVILDGVGEAVRWACKSEGVDVDF